MSVADQSSAPTGTDATGSGSERVSPSGYKRPKVTRRSVLLADKVAAHTIAVGGIFVIVAVMGIMVFLIAETLPLFRGADVLSETGYSLGHAPQAGGSVAVDEYGTTAVELGADGTLRAFHVGSGTPLEVAPFALGGGRITALARTPDGENVAFGFADGSVRFGEVAFAIEVLPAAELPEAVRPLNDTAWTDGRSVYSTLPGDQVRRVTARVSLDEPVVGSPGGHPVRALDYRRGGTAERPTRAFVVLDASGSVTLNLAQAKKNLLTGAVTQRLRSTALPDVPAGGDFLQLLMTEKGDLVYVALRDGTVYRYNAKTFDQPFLAETFRVTPAGVELGAIRFLIGENALLVGAADGSVSVHFPVNAEDAETPDGIRVVRARELPPHGAGVVRVDASLRGKTFVTADAAGEIWLRHATSEKTLARLRGRAGDAPLLGLALSPRVDGLLALQAGGKATYWELAAPHPETSWRTLFGKVWYEGYPEPSYTWQSTGMTDAFESKLSLVPLIFGTIKGTVYSMLFAIPIAMLAAIYTSEFLHPRVRGVVKPMMEMMASLPSVVLGFVAALVLAPLVETWIAAVLLAFLVIPLALLMASYAWQFLPVRLANRFAGPPKLGLMLIAVILAVWGTYRIGPAFEGLFFSGDFKRWVSGQGESVVPFLFLLFLPLAYVIVGLVQGRFGGPQFRLLMRRSGVARAATLDVLRWLLTTLAAMAVSYALAVFAESLGLDPRGTFVDTYAQRNTLVIAFAMGFAVIPIIYTLAEDALNSVPEHLRSASLGCGATPWQTALWIILPTAMSGVFSAVMIGMGRAVGETMIVVMAAGNTPLLDWNVFNGLRALSANIAVELPEAVVGGTLYRTLFLSALVLFAMTFVINTVAEMVRLRFRKRSMSL